MRISFLGLLTVIGAGLLLFYILQQAKLQAEKRMHEQSRPH